MEKTKKTKILAVSDIHGDSELAKKIADKAKKENVDLIIFAGDITLVEREFKGVIKPFEDLKKEILIIPGNHETNSTIKAISDFYPAVKNIHGYSIKRENLGIFGAGYDTTTGPFWIEEEELFKTLKKGFNKIKGLNKKIMITHSHHRGSKAEFSGFPGSIAVKKAIKSFKPDVLISGHIHEAGGLYEKIGKTRVFHVGRKPAIFEI